MKNAIFIWVLFFSLTANFFAQPIPFKSANGKFGYKDTSGKIIIPAQFQGATPFIDGKAIVNQHNKLSKINTSGEIFFTYDNAIAVNNKFIIVSKKTGIIDEIGLIDSNTGKEITPLKYNAVERLTDSLVIAGIKSNDAWSLGILNIATGKEVTAPNPKYNKMNVYNDELLIVYNIENNSQKMGFLDKSSGRELVPPIYDEVLLNHNGSFTIVKDGKYGLYDNMGKLLVPPQYDEKITRYSKSNPFPVKKNGKSGYVNHLGNVVIPFIYDSASLFSDEEYAGYAKVEINKKEGMINREGKVVVPIVYNYIGSFKEGLADVMMNMKFGFIDQNGKLVVPTIYDEVNSFSEGLAVVRLNQKRGYIDKTGKVVIPIIYYRAYDFNKGKANVILEMPKNMPTDDSNESMKIRWEMLDNAEYYIDKYGNKVN